VDKATREANTRRMNELAVLAQGGSEEALVKLWEGMKKFSYRKFWSWRNNAPYPVRRSYHFDDPEGVLGIAFMDAVRDYDVSKSAFITFYGIVLDNDLGHVIRDVGLEKHTGSLSWFSIDEPVINQQRSNGRRPLLLGETIPYTVDFDTGLDIERMLALIEELPERERYLVEEYYLKDGNQTKVGLTLGISQSHVSRLLKEALHTLRIGLLGQENVS